MARRKGGRKPSRQKLTALQRRFIEEYQLDRNAMQAAIRAGYSSETAKGKGAALLKNPLIREAINAAEHERLEAFGVTQDRVIMELARVGFADLRNVMDWDENGATLRPSRDLTADEAAAISELMTKTGKDGVQFRVKLHDKLKALEMLSRHLGIFNNDGAPGIAIGQGATVNLNVAYVSAAELPDDEEGSA